MPSRVSLLVSILRVNLVLIYEIAPDFRGGVHSYRHTPSGQSEFIGPVPSLSGHAIAYRWRSLPRVRRHRTSEPQGKSKRVLPWQVTMDQLICAFLSHTHYWYDVGMLKVPAYTNTTAFVLDYCGETFLFYIRKGKFGSQRDKPR